MLYALIGQLKTPLDMSPYKVVYDKPYHLPLVVEHRARWAIQMLNFNLTEANEVRKLQ